MRTKLLVMFTVLLPLVCVVFTPVPGRASAISDTLTVFNPAGGIAFSAVAFEGGEDAGGSVFLISGSTSLANPAMFGNPTTLCEVGTSPCDATTPFTSLSDIVGVVPVTIPFVGTHYYLGFTSAAANGLLPGIQGAYGGFGPKFLIENPGVPLDVTYLLNPTLSASGWTATFVSSAIPEPASLVLVGTGLIGLAASLARRRKSS